MNMDVKHLCFHDFKDLKECDFQSVFSSLEKEINRSLEKIPVLFNLKDLFISNSFKKAFTVFIVNNSDMISAIAIYGVEKGVRKLILKSIQSSIYFAESREDAEEWLFSF